MKQQISQKVIVIGVTVLVLGFFGYKIFSGDSKPEGKSSQVNSEVVGEDILVLVEKLNLIKIDPSIFSSPLFTSLQDRSVLVTPEVQGRANPFSQIGTDIGGGQLSSPVVQQPGTSVTPATTTQKKP